MLFECYVCYVSMYKVKLNNFIKCYYTRLDSHRAHKVYQYNFLRHICIYIILIWPFQKVPTLSPTPLGDISFKNLFIAYL